MADLPVPSTQPQTTFLTLWSLFLDLRTTLPLLWFEKRVQSYYNRHAPPRLGQRRQLTPLRNLGKLQDSRSAVVKRQSSHSINKHQPLSYIIIRPTNSNPIFFPLRP